MFRSAVFKLTVAYVAIVMSVCMLFSIVLYHFAVSELHLGIYNQYTRWLNAYQSFGLRHPGTPGAEYALRSHHILLEIIYLNLVLLLVAAIASYLLARRTLRPIEAAHEQQKRFTADVSHELRTPLTSIRMESEVALLDGRATAKSLRATLGSNLEEVTRMETLINNLLLLSSMEAGKLRTVFRKLDINEVIADAVASVSKLAETKQVGLTVPIRPTPSVFVSGDRPSLTQLLVILLENAIKYSPVDSSVNIVLSSSRGRVAISITDSGEGIPGDALPHIFDRFYRADVSRSTDTYGLSKGFGIGLSLAKLIADLHRGEIIVSSAPGNGTTAKVVLPARGAR